MLETKEIPLNLIDAGEHEQRFAYADEEFEDLKASLRKDGVLVPIIVKPAGDRFIIIQGHRRTRAAAEVGLTTIPAQIQTGDSALAQRTAFIVQMFHKDPTPVELAVAIAKAVAAGEDSLQDLARGLHRSVDWVKRQVALLDWPDDVLQTIHAGQLSVAAASNLAEVDNDAYRAFLLEQAAKNGATARTTAAWLQAYRASLPAPEALQAQPAPPGSPAPALIPQAPCLCCGVTHRVDELSHVPLCARCIPAVRRLGIQAGP